MILESSRNRDIRLGVLIYSQGKVLAQKVDVTMERASSGRSQKDRYFRSTEVSDGNRLQKTKRDHTGDTRTGLKKHDLTLNPDSTTKCRTTGHTPNEVLFGRKPAGNLEQSKEKTKEQFDKQTKVKSFKVGDTVFLRNQNTRPGRVKKLEQLWNGPYKVIEKISEVNYRIKKGRYEHVVHAYRLKYFKELYCRFFLKTPDEFFSDM